MDPMVSTPKNITKRLGVYHRSPNPIANDSACDFPVCKWSPEIPNFVHKIQPLRFCQIGEHPQTKNRICAPDYT